MLYVFFSCIEKFLVFYVIIKILDRCYVRDFILFFCVFYVYFEQCIMRVVFDFVKMGYIVLKILVELGYLFKVVDYDN